MSFLMSRKKKYKFHIVFLLEELSSIPFVNSFLFTKLRLVDGGKFLRDSPRQAIKQQSVKWNTKYEFECRMSANTTSGILDPCLFRVSIRKEIKGGKSYERLGFKDINLAEFAGVGRISRRFILEGYSNQPHRLDNSTLHITLEITLVTGDPCFKTCPEDNRFTRPLEMDNTSNISVAVFMTEAIPVIKEDWKKGHSRNSSHTSQISGYNGSQQHSRRGSTESGQSEHRIKHANTKINGLYSSEQFDHTRADCDETIMEIIQQTNLDESTEANSVGLCLTDISRGENTPIVLSLLPKRSFS